MNHLFPIIRSAFAVRFEPFTLTPEEYEKLVAFGKKQSILPVIYAGLKNMGCDYELLKSMNKERGKDLRLFVLQNVALKRIVVALDGAQIPYILLKGAVLRDLYPSPEMRTSSDIDVLVKEKDLVKAVEIIEDSTDFKSEHRAYHDISMVNSSVCLELHFSIKENAENIDELLDRAWEYAKHEKGSMYSFTPEFQVFYIVAHMSHHFLHGGLGIRHFLDLWLLRKKTQYDEETVRAMCSKTGILTFYNECNNLANIWLEDGKHTETTKLLEQFCLSGGVFGNQKFKNAARQKDRRGLKYVLGRVLPPAYQVKEYYDNDTRKKHILAYYYLKRWISWLKRRKQLISQVSEIMHADKAYIDKTDELFRRLGMA